MRYINIIFIAVFIFGVVWFISSSVTCFYTGTHLLWSVNNTTKNIGYEEIIVEEKWRNYNFEKYTRNCEPTIKRIICNTEIIGYDCYKYVFDIPVYYYNIVCRADDVNKTYYKRYEFNYYKLKDDMTRYNRSIPYKNTIVSRELFIEPKNVSHQTLNNFFKFNETLVNYCSIRLNIELVFPIRTRFSENPEKVCVKYKKLLLRRTEKIPRYESIITYEIYWYHIITIISIILVVQNLPFLCVLNYCILRNNVNVQPEQINQALQIEDPSSENESILYSNMYITVNNPYQ